MDDTTTPRLTFTCDVTPGNKLYLSVPHDQTGNTCQGNTSQYCTTLELTADRWRDVIEAIEATLPATTDPASTVETVIAR